MRILKKVKSWLKLYKQQFSVKKIQNKRAKNDQSVIVIKLDAIGDFIIWLDSAKEYTKIFNGKKITLLCNSVCEPIGKSLNYFDEVISVDIRRFETDKNYQTEVRENLGKYSFGVLVQASYSRTLHMDMIAAAIPAAEKIGFVSDESKSNLSRKLVSKKRKKILDGFYDKLIPTSFDSLMELTRNCEFVKSLGGIEFEPAAPLLPQAARFTPPEKPYFVIFPGASTKIKMWRVENFAEIVDYVVEKTGWDVFICGSKSEKYLYDKITELVKNKDKVLNYCGKTSLTELTEVIRNSKLVVSNDTSGIHYAAATDVPAVCVFGEYNYGRFLPYDAPNTVRVCSAGMKCRNCASKKMTLKCKFHILKSGRYLCLDKVTVGMVKAEINGLLGYDE